MNHGLGDKQKHIQTATHINTINTWPGLGAGQNEHICKAGMLEQHFHYITYPLKSFVFTLSADSGLQNFFLLYSQKPKGLSIKDKMFACKRQKNEWF